MLRNSVTCAPALFSSHNEDSFIYCKQKSFMNENINEIGRRSFIMKGVKVAFILGGSVEAITRNLLFVKQNHRVVLELSSEQKF